MRELDAVSIGKAGFTLINTFTVDPARQEAVIKSLVDVTENLMVRLPGFISTTVHASKDGQHVANYVQWRSKDDFLGMFQNPEAKAHMQVVHDLAQNVLPIEYEVRYHRHTA